MFNLDRWREILDTLWRSKLRSLLTAFSVAWGIFMLVFLLGMGNGLQNGVQQEFADDATNSVWMFSGRTSTPYDGMPIGRRIVFTNRDVAAVHRLTGVDKITGRFLIGDGRPGAAPVQSRAVHRRGRRGRAREDLCPDHDVADRVQRLPFAPPDPSLTIALTAAAVIAAFGALAGMRPAYYAAKIQPVEALRAE